MAKTLTRRLFTAGLVTSAAAVATLPALAADDTMAARAILDHSTRLEPRGEEARLTEEEELKLLMDECELTLEEATTALERTNASLTGPRRHLWRRC